MPFNLLRSECVLADSCFACDDTVTSSFTSDPIFTSIHSPTIHPTINPCLPVRFSFSFPLLQVINQTQDHLFLLLKEAARYLHLWSVSIMKSKAIYHTLNQMNYNSSTKMLIGEGWHPVSELDNIRAALKLGTVSDSICGGGYGDGRCRIRTRFQSPWSVSCEVSAMI